jgi:hypothetical protein
MAAVWPIWFTKVPEFFRLITCGGPFDKASGQYLDNIVVYSHLVS